MPWENREQARAYQIANKEKIREQRRGYYLAHIDEIRQKSSNFYYSHKEQVLAKGKTYRETHKQEIDEWCRANRSRLLKYGKQYNKEHREERKAYDQKNRERFAKYRRDNKNLFLQKKREYLKKHPDVRQARQVRRRAWKAKSPVNDFTPRQWESLKKAFHFKCAYCGKKSKRLTMDHITPLAKGGTHTLSNIVPACAACNSKKGVGSPHKPVQPLLITVA